MKLKMKAWLGATLSACLCFSVGVGVTNIAIAEETTEESYFNRISTTVSEINNENLDSGNAFVMVLSATDFMTATEWSNQDYKWLNAEEILTFEDRANIDTANNNVCNAQLDQNLSDYNFEEYILIDGISLSEFAQTHTYTLFANKRTRINTLSIDFTDGAWADISTVEIKEGCELPTLSHSYFSNPDTPICLYVTETVIYRKDEGKWTDFLAYEADKEYAVDQKISELSLETSYKGHAATALDGFTGFFMDNAIQGEKLDHKALSSSADTQQDKIMVLKFLHPIDAAEFNKLNLKVYTNYQRELCTYNAEDVTTESLGTPLENFTVGGGAFSYLNLTNALYVGEDNKVRSIVFQFKDDGRVEEDGSRHHFFFVSFNLSNENMITKDSFSIMENEESYDLTFRFYKAGDLPEGTVLDTSKILLNGYSLNEIMAECSAVTAQWHSFKGIYQIHVNIPKSYTGAAQIKNANYSFTGNNICVQEGLVFPDGETLEKSYTCRLYNNEKIVDCELVSNFKQVEIIDVGYKIETARKNLRFVLYFDQNITSAPYYHACELESWRSIDLKRTDESLYDEGIAKIFVDGGYKSALLDNIVINGKTIGEWHAQDSKALTNVQIHYGNTALNTVDIIFEALSPNTYNQLYDLVMAGNGITIEVNEALKFMMNLKMKQSQTFTFSAGEFSEVKEDKFLHVYFNGSEVEQGDIVTVNMPISEKSVTVAGVQNYQITYEKNGEKTEYSITYGDNQTFTFTVLSTASKESEKSVGCSAQITAQSMSWMILLLMGAMGILLTRDKKHEEKADN